MSIDKLYENFLTTKDSSFLNTGDIGELNIPPINDKFTENRITPLMRPILSLEGVGGLTLNSIILEVFFFLDRVVTYFSGLFEFDDYTEEKKKKDPSIYGNNNLIQKPCKQFNRIKNIFIKNWYFSELYIAYGQGYVNEELRVLRMGRQHNKTNLIEPDIYPNCKWRLYSLKRDNSGNITFTSLISGIEGHKFKAEKMVKASFGGKGLFLDWFDLAKEFVSMNRAYVQMARLSCTKIKAGVNSAQDLYSELSDILGWKFYYQQKDIGMTNDIEPEAFCDITDPKEFMHGNMLYISQRMNTLGMVINPTNKAERMTTGEHYKDLKFSSCTESQMLSNLAGLCEDLNKVFGTQIDVYLTSSLQANGAPKTTQNPYEQFQNQSQGFDGSFAGTNNQFNN